MANEHKMLKICDLIVGLRDNLTERQRDLELASKAIKDRDDKLAEKDEQLGNLTAELEALRQGVDAYRLASSKDSASVRQWEDAVGSLIWPLKLSTVICHPQQLWHDGEIPAVLESVPGIEWEIERKSCDQATATGIIAGTNPEVRCRPVNASWEDVCRAAAVILGNAHCMQGVARMEDTIVFETLGIDKASKASARVCAEYHKAYSLAVEFLRPAAVTVAAVTRADLEGFRREHLKPLYEAPESRPFRFVDGLGRPVSWTLLDPAMTATGAPPKTEATEKPGAEFRQGLRPKIFDRLTDIIWDDQRTPHFASRPVNATWAGVQRRAAELMGREDCLAGRERLTTEGVYDAVGMTHEDRAKTDGAAVAYGKAYSAAVVLLRPEEVTAQATKEARMRDAIKWYEGPELMAPFCYVGRNDGLPISWRVLDPEFKIASEGKPSEFSSADGAVHKVATIRGSTDALAVLMKIFAHGPKFCPGNEDIDYVSTLGQDALIRLSPDGNYMITALGRLILAEELKHLLDALS